MKDELALLSGTSNPGLFKDIAGDIRKRSGWANFKPIKSTIGKFSDGEPKIEIHENIRGKNVYILQSTCDPVGHNLLELLLMIDACQRASAQSVTAVVPYFGLARQDRKKRPREPISASCAAKLIRIAGAERIISVDLHVGQIQGFFDGPYDNLYARPAFLKYIRENINNDLVIVTPDAGGADRAQGLATRLNDAPLAIIDKRRPKPNVAEIMNVIGIDNVNGRSAIIFDDMCDTAGTLCNAAKALIEAGATSVDGACTHPVLSGPALEKIEKTEELRSLIITNTIPLSDAAQACDKIKVISIADLVAEAITRSFKGESISELFN